MPPAASTAAHRPRSAEQMARLLLSNGFRYDSWEAKETAKSIQAQGGQCTTLQLSFRQLSPEVLRATDVDAVNLVLFDPSRRMFYGASYQLERADLSRPIVVQAAPSQLLVVETLAQETRPDRSLEQYRVTRWGCCPVTELKSGGASIALRRGTAQLLQVDQTSWPPECLPSAPSDAALLMDVESDTDASLAKVMRELVPPGVFVAADFTRSAPRRGVATFRLTVTNIELTATSQESAVNLSDAEADWSVAAIAHNGFRPLGRGSEVPLVLVGGSEKSGKADRRGSAAASASGSSASSSSNHRRTAAVAPHTVLLRSDLPLEMSDLPVHAATSLVLAVRRRAAGARSFAVVGFCVLPLCIMPMQDRDIRVENLPALRGPFSCEDARLLMLDSTSPYGRVPITVTLTVAYHDTGVAGASDEHAAAAATAAPEEITHDVHTSASSSSSSSSRTTSSARHGRHRSHPAESSPQLDASAHGRPAEVLSTADAQGPQQPPAGSLPSLSVVSPGDAIPPSPPLQQPQQQQPSVQSDGDGLGIFKLLCTIMEELHKVRESQEVLLHQTSGLSGSGPAALSPAMQERMNRGLADGGVNVVDLAPRPLAITWKARRLIQEGVQPFLHPLHHTVLDDTSPVVGQLDASLFGFRVEGITMDKAVHMPADACLFFSFGPLPYQRVGPLHLVAVEEAQTSSSYKVYDDQNRAGFVWTEPVQRERDDHRGGAMRKFKGLSSAVLYVHIYDALTMFYVATAQLPLAAFRRPLSATCAMAPMDVLLQRDLSMTEHAVPAKVFPAMRQAGQLHLTLLCLGVAAPGGEERAAGGDAAAVGRMRDVMRLPSNGATGTRVITAKKLRHADELRPSADTANSLGRSSSDVPAGAPAGDAAAASTTESTLHWQRAQHIKQQLQSQQQECTGGTALLPGVPDAHVQAAQEAAEMEYRLRQLEYERAAIKSKRIAAALLSRLTVEHDVHVIAWRPEVVRTPFANPFNCAMQFFVEVEPADRDACAVVESGSVYLGPRERTEVVLVVRLTHATAEATVLTARVYSEKRELVCCIRVSAVVAPPVVDRRYELFGAAGTTISKRLLLRAFSPASFPDTANSAALLQRMRDLCAFVATSSESTSVSTNAVLDPITQTHLVAWEEATVTTTIPNDLGRQRIEYVTLFHDAAMSRVYETWELCIFACESAMTRDVYWGQTTALGLPAEGTEELYCSDASVRVERRGPSYVLRLHPREVGTQQMLLHTLQDNNLRKTLITVPTVYPTPSYTQVIELSTEEARGPVLRRLTFVHRGDAEEVFQVHHNYKLNLRVSPAKFALAPGDSQFVGLQFDMLALPPGQLEGRWPMWIFINNAEDKTVESYHLEIVLRAHPVVRVAQ